MSSVVQTPAPPTRPSLPTYPPAPARPSRSLWKIAGVVLVVAAILLGTVLVVHAYNSYAISLNPPGTLSYPAETPKSGSSKPKTDQPASGQGTDATDSAAGGDKAGGSKPRTKATATPGA